MMIKGKDSRFPLLVLVSFLFFLAACGGQADQTVTFLKDEKWEATSDVGFAIEMMPLIGTAADIEASLDEAVIDLEASGVDASWSTWRDETTVYYSVETSGTGYVLLNETVFERDAFIDVIEADGERQISFSYSNSSGLFSGGSYSLTLIGGEIIESNGTIIDDGVVQWVNPTYRMQATLTEKRTSLIGALFGVIGVFVVLGLLGGGAGGAFLWYTRRRQKNKTIFCVNCGTEIAALAKFCPNCGQAR